MAFGVVFEVSKGLVVLQISAVDVNIAGDYDTAPVGQFYDIMFAETVIYIGSTSVS